MHAEIRLAARGAARPAVPLSLIRMNGGRPWLARQGVFGEVRGSSDGGWFYFDDQDALGQRFSSEGTWPENNGERSANPGKIQAVMGAVQAASAAIVALPDVARDSRLAWLLDEESLVKTGDLIAKLDRRSAERGLDTAESELASAQAKRDSAARDSDMAGRDHDFRKLREENQLQQFVLELRKKNGQAPEDPSPKPPLKLGDIEIPAGAERKAFLKARRDLCAATAELAAASLELHRLQARPSEFVSPAELEKISNACHRQELLLTKAQIDLARATRGPAPEERAKGDQEYFEKKNGAFRSVRRAAMELAKKNKDLSQAESELAIKKSELAVARRHLSNVEIRAPAAGLLRYERIWDSGALRRPSAGVVVRDGSRLFSIPDTSRLAVVVQLPEHRYAKIKVGQKLRIRLPSDSSAGELEGTVREVGSLFEALETRSSGGNQAEPLGETVFTMIIDVNTAGRKLKPGALAEVIFP
jgi:multidrug resistance efflux pump